MFHFLCVYQLLGTRQSAAERDCFMFLWFISLVLWNKAAPEGGMNRNLQCLALASGRHPAPRGAALKWSLYYLHRYQSMQSNRAAVCDQIRVQIDQLLLVTFAVVVLFQPGRASPLHEVLLV